MSARIEGERILVVDNAPDTVEVLKRNLTAQGYRVLAANDVPSAIAIIEATPLDLVITDLKMPRVSGLDLIRHLRENSKDVEVIMITGYASIEGAIEAVKIGAEEYLAKPFTDEELLSAVRRALAKLRSRRAGEAALRTTCAPSHGILGKSPAMQKVFTAISKAAATPATVLITGESGTGKELVARAIHYNGPRASAPFVPVNCGAIPEGLLESELFGHVKGAFTGATESRAGFFQTADGGTIFLDEIGETSLAMQVRLLRVLEDKEIYMVGATRSRKVDVRVLVATNKDLAGLVSAGAFREDLYFRLNVLTIPLPPLRERREDVPLLASHFMTKFAHEIGKPVPRVSEKARQVLCNYAWPGNVRELENVAQRLVIMTEAEVIDVPDLPSLMRFTVPKDAGLHRTLAEVEVEHIRNVLASVEGNKTRAAEILAIDRKTLRQKMGKMKP